MKLIRIMFLTLSLVLVLSAREKVNVNFADLEIKDFIKLVAKITNKNILVNHKVNGTVNFISNSTVYDDELIGILVSVLASKGFTLVEDGSIYEMVRSTDAAKHNARVKTQGKKLRGSFMVTQAIRVKSENVDIVAAKVRYLISKTAKLMTMKESNTLLITDYPKNIETIKRVIKDLDIGNTPAVKIVKVKHAGAKKLQTKLVNIAKSLFNEKVNSQKVKIILDANTNSVILIGNKKNVEKLNSIVKKLDIESNIGNTVKIFNLKNADAKSVLASLNAIISKQKYADPAMKPNLSASEEINAVIVIGEPNIIKGIQLIIDELDKEKYQVYVQARIIEISQGKTEDLGIQYGFGGGAGTTSTDGIYAMSANIGSLGTTATALSTAASKKFALFATLNFLETHGASKSISNPSILCVNNKESSIYVGKTISVQKSSTPSTEGAIIKFDRKDVGLTLKIKPRVSSLDKVGLDVEVSLENVLQPDSNQNPVTSKQEVKTQAILRNGEDILIGGLVRINTTKNIEKIPLLGDIPWIGEWLFTYTSVNIAKENLIVILTPYIIEKSKNLSELQQKLGATANKQSIYNKNVNEIMEEKLTVKSVEDLQERPLHDNILDPIQVDYNSNEL